MPKTTKAKKKVAKTKTKVVSKPKKVAAKAPIKISKTYQPKDTEKYMCEKHKVFFRIKLNEWKKELVKANNEALYNGSMDDNSISADIVDQASSYTDKNVEMKAINRQIKLISEIDKALMRIRDDTYGFCLDTAEPIGLKRLMARPVANTLLLLKKNMKKMKRFMQMTKKNKKNSAYQNSISFLFAKKYIYFYYPFIWAILILYLFLK